MQRVDYTKARWAINFPRRERYANGYLLRMIEMEFVKKTKLVVFAHRNSMRISMGFIDAMDGKNEAILKEALGRAKKNGRTTLMEQDV